MSTTHLAVHPNETGVPGFVQAFLDYNPQPAPESGTPDWADVEMLVSVPSMKHAVVQRVIDRISDDEFHGLIEWLLELDRIDIVQVTILRALLNEGKKAAA